MNVVNTKEMMAYVISVLEEYGITYMDGQDIVRAKKNDEAVADKLTRLLFDLCVLQMFDFDVKLDVVQLRGEIQSMKQIVLAHLCEAECPYLVEVAGGKVGLNFQSSREILICVGWVLATADLFGRIEEKIFLRALSEIEEVAPHSTEPGNKGGQGMQRPVDFRTEQQSINSLHRILLSKLQSTSNLHKKKAKLMKRIESILKQNNRNESIEELLSSDKSYQRVRAEKTAKLIELVEKEIRLMRSRKLFWAWMVTLWIIQQTVIKADKEETQSEGFEEEPDYIIDKLVVDNTKLQQFIDKCNTVEELYEEHHELLQLAEACWRQRVPTLTDKEKREVNAQTKRMQERLNLDIPEFESGAALKINSFMGIQLQQEIFPDASQQPETNTDKMGQAQSLKQHLMELCKQNIDNLEGLKFL